MSALTVTAPGKIVLAGEYAVLHGAHAIAAAVNRRARVTIAPVPGAGVELHTPGYGNGSVHYDCNAASELKPRHPQSQDSGRSLFECTWEAAAPSPGRGWHITLDTTEFRDAATGHKLGLGSSAAVCVALTAALRPELAAEDVAKLADQAHRLFQGGGSGVDIACAAYGNFIDFQMAPGSTRVVRLPQGLHIAVLWSGQPVKTAAKIKSLESSLQDPQRHATLQTLQSQSDLLAGSLRSGDAAKVYRQFADYIDSLRAFDLDMTLDIFGAGHAALADAAVRKGLLYKPCGAGGGDVGIAIALDSSALATFIGRAPEFGFVALDLQAGADGMHREGEWHDA